MEVFSVFPAPQKIDTANMQAGELFSVLATPRLEDFAANLDFDRVTNFVIRAASQEGDNIHAYITGIVEEPPAYKGRGAILTVSWLDTKDHRAVLDIN